jgi:hypothetical protein
VRFGGTAVLCGAGIASSREEGWRHQKRVTMVMNNVNLALIPC